MVKSHAFSNLDKACDVGKILIEKSPGFLRVRGLTSLESGSKLGAQP